MKYGNYGDILVYRPDGFSNITPIIHRAMGSYDASWFNANLGTNYTHGEYLTKGDNNPGYDQEPPPRGLGLEPVEGGWVVGKALFSVPLLGYPTLHYPEFAAIVIILLIIHEVYVSRGEEKEEQKPGKKAGKKKGRR